MKVKNTDTYLDLVTERKKQWNVKVMVIPIVVGALGAISKELIKGQEDLEIRGQVETIQTLAILGSARILRRVLETCCHSDSRKKKTSANVGVKNYQKSKISIMKKQKTLSLVNKKKQKYSKQSTRCNGKIVRVQPRSKRVRSSVAPLRSLLDLWKVIEFLYSPKL